MEEFDARQYVAITERGGTWAAAALIILGGLGMHVTGPLTADDLDGHITAGKVLAVDPDGQIEVGPGTSGHLCSIAFRNYSFAGWDAGSTAVWATGSQALFQSGSTLSIGEGTTAKIEAGAILQVLGSAGNIGKVIFGSYTEALWTGNSSAIFGTGTGIALQGGSTLTFISGSTVTGEASLDALTLIPTTSFVIQGTTKIQGVGFLRSKLIIQSLGDIEVESSGRILVKAGAIVDYASTSTVTGTITSSATVTRSGSETLSGSGAWTNRRVVTAPDSSTTIDGSAQDLLIIRGVLGATRTYALDDPAGKALRLTITRVCVGTQPHSGIIQWPLGTTLVTYPAGTDTRGVAMVESDGTDWFVAAEPRGNVS